MQLAKRVQNLPPYLFVDITRKIAEKKARGEDVISFALGDPDIPTPQHILDRLCVAARDPANHRYPETDGLPELRQAIASWYERRFGLVFDSDEEVLPLIGSKDGIGHVALCFIDPGDTALVPDPGYPVYSIGTMFAGGESYYMPLTEENGFLPDLEAVPAGVARKAKLMWINYPNNPTAAVADLDFFDRVVAFAREYDVAVCHDAPYTEVSFDGYRPVSFLQAKGARDVGVEFHSLSKGYNMTGWRIGMVVGNQDMVNALMRVNRTWIPAFLRQSSWPASRRCSVTRAVLGNTTPLTRAGAIWWSTRSRKWASRRTRRRPASMFGRGYRKGTPRPSSAPSCWMRHRSL
jgi:LL-diaminopimelate aminotransferase